MEPLKLVVVSAGLSQPSSTRLLADRLAEATVRHASGRREGPSAGGGEALDGGAGSRVAGTAEAAGTAGADGAPPAVRVQVVELRDMAGDIAHNMVTGFPSPVLREALDAVAGADGLITVTPVFTASYSGLFKSFFDVLDNTALSGKPVLVGATGGTARHSLVLEHAMRPLFAYLHAVVVPTAVYAASADWGSAGGDNGGGADDEGLAERVERAGRELAGLMGGPSRAAGGDRAAGAAEQDGTALDVVPFEQQLAALRPR